MVWYKRVLKVLGYVVLGVVSLVLLVILGILGYFIFFNSVGTEPKGPAATPGLEKLSLSEWEAAKPQLKKLFLQEIYGPFPDNNDKLVELSRQTLSVPELDDFSRTEQILYQSQSGKLDDLSVILISPKKITNPVPVIITQNFCGNRASFPFEGVNKPFVPYPEMCESDDMGPLIETIMGAHLITPPIEKIIKSGYALAGFYPAEIVPDDGALAPAYAEKMGSTGALSTWAWGFNRVAEALGQDKRFDNDRMAAWGHSRHGKAALVAAAFEDQINLVISHQSGTGGASLGVSGVGEPIAAIMDQYGYWFDPNYRQYAEDQTTLPIDQHQLIALIAPTPVILGNGQHDKWGDPQTAFRALEGATPIYELYGVTGLDQPDLVSPNFEANLSFHMRPGPHGTRVSDWEAFLGFLDAHFN